VIFTDLIQQFPPWLVFQLESDCRDTHLDRWQCECRRASRYRGFNHDAICCAIGIDTFRIRCHGRRAKGRQDCQSHPIAQRYRALYEVKEDGTVLIDWAEVEALAASKQDQLLLPQARVMLAIRDGRWKAMDHSK
jgi:hypothetical protein